jgi:hypothetical protein
MILHSVLACAACYGASDSPMAKGMNWGIFTLLGVIAFVLISIASVGFVLVRRAAAVAPTTPGLPESSNHYPVSSGGAPASSLP